MILLVLLHKGRGGGLSDMFGGGVSSSLGGSSVAERNLDRITVGIGVIWFACVIALGPACWPTAGSEQEGTPSWLVEETRSAAAGSAPARWARPSAARPRPRQSVTYFCSHEHRSVVTFAVEAHGPGLVGLPALRAPGQPGLATTRRRRRRSSPTRRTWPT